MAYVNIHDLPFLLYEVCSILKAFDPIYCSSRKTVETAGRESRKESTLELCVENKVWIVGRKG